MDILILTIFLSVLLAFLFMTLFWMDQGQHKSGGPERDALLPLDDETPVTARSSKTTENSDDQAPS